MSDKSISNKNNQTNPQLNMQSTINDIVSFDQNLHP